MFIRSNYSYFYICDDKNLIVFSEIKTIRKIQTVLEYVIKEKRPLLIVAPVDQQVKAALMMNKIKGRGSLLSKILKMVRIGGLSPKKEIPHNIREEIADDDEDDDGDKNE